VKYLLLFFMTTHAFAFTLNTNINAGFDKEEVKVYVTSNSTCTNAGVTNSELLDIAVEAANKFWNKVPTSHLRIKKGGITSTTDNKFLSGILCVTDSDTSCDPNTSVPKVTNIVIACNSDTTKNFTSGSYFALTVPNNFANKKIKGSVILINDSANSAFDTLSRAEMVNVLAHELGHAVGLGHTPDKAALMYYTEFSQRHRLGQDDIDGISFLYPNKLHGCTSLFGTIDVIDDQEPPTSGPFTFLGQLIFGMLATFGLLIFTKKITYLLQTHRQQHQS
jgi:hypothetical protein